MKLTEEQLYRMKSECDTIILDDSKFNTVLNDCKYFDRGSFATCYITSDGAVLKKYFADPHLDFEENGRIAFWYKDVIDNLINISKLEQKDSAIPYKFYVVNNELKAYKSPFMMGDSLEAICYKKMNLYLSDIKNAWEYGYYLACYYAQKKITMYDLNPSNCNIYNDKLLVYDLDFYRENTDSNIVLKDNYEIINTCFCNFFERFYFDLSYETTIKNFYTDNFCSDFFDEFQYRTNKNCKTLMDVYK